MTDAAKIIFDFLLFSNWLFLAYFLMVNSFYFLLLLSAIWEMGAHNLAIHGEMRGWILGSRLAPQISILAPAHNEAATVRESVRSLLTLYYPNLEVVLVNDGSTDETMAVLAREFELVAIHPIYRQQVPTQPVRGLYVSRTYPNLMVVNKDNGGKADALNAGLNLATAKLVCAIDADTLVEPDAFQRMVRPFLMSDDVVAAGGTIRIANGSAVEGGRVVAPRVPRRPLAGMQVVEYLRAFVVGRLGWNNLGDNLVISGAFGLFLRTAVIAIGGYEKETVGEDMEIVARLRRNGYERKTPCRIAFLPEPVAWTEAPETFRDLASQRDRWYRGLAEVLWRHRRLFFNPRYGALGMVVYPYFFCIELLAPIVEALGLLVLTVGLAAQAVDQNFAILLFLASYGYGMILNVFTLLFEEICYRRYDGMGDRLLLLVWALLENLGYRQLTVFWRLRGLAKLLLGGHEWGTMERRGFEQQRA